MCGASGRLEHVDFYQFCNLVCCRVKINLKSPLALDGCAIFPYKMTQRNLSCRITEARLTKSKAPRIPLFKTLQQEFLVILASISKKILETLCMILSCLVFVDLHKLRAIPRKISTKLNRTANNKPRHELEIVILSYAIEISE